MGENMLHDYVVPVIVVLISIRILFFIMLMLCASISTQVLMIYENREIRRLTHSLAKNTAYRNYLFPVKIFMEGILLYAALIVGRMKSQKIRLCIYRLVFRLKIDKKVVIYNNLQVRRGHKIIIGKGTVVGDQCILDGRNGLEIGSNVNISTGVWIWTEQHDPQSPTFGTNGKKVKIADRAWISSRVTILPGITIGEGAVVAANAVVTKDIEPFSIYGGIPAKKIAERNKELNYEFNGEYLPFF
jgi:acetyltransferase-like isoleucine patch superfamily enzyme